MVSIQDVLRKSSKSFSKVVPLDLNADRCMVLDLTSKSVSDIDAADFTAFNNYVESMMKKNHANVAVGGYFENRIAYRKSKLFDNSTGEKRSVHLGIDIWCKAGTPIFAFADAKVHSFHNNNHFLDYGPTIILQHTLDGVTFYTLYGHLSEDSLNGLKKGRLIKKGSEFARVGSYPTNGGWPPHLHFQLITDLLGKEGDFPGVAAPSEVPKWKKICLDPNVILMCNKLKN